MTGKLEQLKSKVWGFVTERREFPRREVTLSVSLPVGVSVPNELLDPDADHYPQPIMGRTRDASESGLSIVLPTLQLGDQEIKAQGHPLRVILSLPRGLIVVQTQTTRAEEIKQEDGSVAYLLGLAITRMSDRDRANYRQFLQTGGATK